MLTYKFEAKEKGSGEKISSEVQADSERSAADKIKKMGYTPITISQKSNGIPLLSTFSNRVSSKERIIFARQLSTLINAGLPLVQSLRSVLKQTKSKALQAVIAQIISDVEAGKNFSAALEAHPRVFNKVFTSLVAAGETSGTLDASLERLALQQEKDAEVISKVRGAMVYPIIVILVMLAVVGFMLVKVLPQVQLLYEGFPGAKLPLVTVVLLATSNLVIKFWWVFVVLLVFAVVFGSRWARTIGGKRVIDKLKMRLPPFGPLFMKMYMARFARTGSTLVASGVPLLQVLEITGDAVDNMYIKASLVAASEQVKGGKALSDSLAGDRNFLDLVPNMLKIGEESGQIEKMMERTADYYEKEVDNQIKTVSTIIEPIMMVLLGVVALVIVAAVLLPVYGIAGQSGSIR